MARRGRGDRVAPGAWTRLRAVLAAGIVLGLGAVTTLAAWTDSEVGTASFAASAFDIESRTAAAGSWSSNTSSPGATLAVTSGSGMSPGTSAYAWIDIRTSLASTVGGTVTLSASAASGTLGAALSYRMVQLSAASNGSGCGASSFSAGATYIAGTSSGYLGTSTVPSSPVAMTVAAAGASPIGLCIEVLLPTGTANSYQGTSATVTWTFSASSGS